MTIASLKFQGKVWVFGDNLNTDAMYPAFAMKMEPPEAAKHIFYEVRPGWTDQVSPGDIVLAGKNFGRARTGWAHGREPTGAWAA